MGGISGWTPGSLSYKSDGGLITLGKWDEKQLLVLLMFPVRIMVFMADEQNFFKKYHGTVGHGTEHCLKADISNSAGIVFSWMVWSSDHLKYQSSCSLSLN